MDTSDHSARKTANSRADGSSQLVGWPETAAFHARRSAFSLIEITLAVGIMGFGFVAILGLVPLGLNSFRDTKNLGISSQISEQILSELQTAPFTNQTKPTASLTQNNPVGTMFSLPVRYFNDQGIEVLSTDATGIYQANVRVLVGPSFVQSPAAGAVANADVASVTIQVAYDPGRVVPDADGTTFLWTGKSGTLSLPIYTFETNVARNF